MNGIHCCYCFFTLFPSQFCNWAHKYLFTNIIPVVLNLLLYTSHVYLTYRLFVDMTHPGFSSAR